MTVIPYKNVKRPIVPVGDLPMLALFARGEQGAWYDPSDLATMFQDAAGTIPVTGVEQPVGLMLDKSGNGNHASQVTTTARPMLSARHNLLNSNGSLSTDMETLAGTAGVTLAQMDGFRSAVRFDSGEASATRYAYRAYTTDSLGDYTFSFYVEMDDPGPPVFGGSGTATADICLNAVGVVGKIPEHIIHVRDNIYRCIATVNVTTTGGKQCGPINYTYNAKRGFKVSGFQLERGSVATKYQRVSTLTDYDWQGWPLYLRRDGVDDKLAGTVPEKLDSRLYVAGAAARLSDGTGNGFGVRATNVGNYVFLYWSSLLRVSARLYSPFVGTTVTGGASVGELVVAEILPRNGDGQLECQTERGVNTVESTMPPEGFAGASSTVELGVGVTPSDRIHGYVALWRNPSPKERTTIRNFLTNKTKVPA